MPSIDQERDHDLKSTLDSRGWREVIRPLLRERCDVIASKLARGKRIPESSIRELQSQFLLLSEMLETPLEFFGGILQGSLDVDD